MMFARLASRPLSDLRRGYSYSMGAFGDETQAHTGLSGYSDADGIEEALARLDARMGTHGKFSGSGRAWVCVFEGGERGTGPDGEDLFAPRRLVCAVDTRAAKSSEEMVAIVTKAISRNSNRTVWVIG